MGRKNHSLRNSLIGLGLASVTIAVLFTIKKRRENQVAVF